jgi:hypothetical protein
VTRRKAGSQKRSARVLIFGEDGHDGEAIRELIQAIKPGGPTPTVRRSPVVYIKGADPRKVRQNASEIAAAVDAERARGPIAAVFVHQDCDAYEPAHESVADGIEAALAAAGVAAGHAVTPAWEMEAWWLLWPDAVAAVCQRWRAPTQYANRDLGRVPHAKEALKAAIKPADLKKGERFREYSEADSPLIAAKVRALGVIDAPQARSASFDAFRRKVERAL